MRQSLDEIGRKFGTVKSSIEAGHTIQYEKYFEPLRDKEIKLLEIGLWKGQSLSMWQEYFTAASIYGIDICNCTQYESSRVKTFMANQEKVETLKIIEPFAPFDIIVDDGGHRMNQQQISFEFLFKFVKSGGIYAIEDLETSYFETYGGGYKKETSTIEYLKNLIDNINFIPNIPYNSEIYSIHFYKRLAIIIKK